MEDATGQPMTGKYGLQKLLWGKAHRVLNEETALKMSVFQNLLLLFRSLEDGY